ncbi:MAG: hypothetical protein FWG98_03050 [Candidatus Cloacimonetes bacterium]|nr:hypothetical protein [Candidatus Cloacimonadota bacterium]
MLQYLKLAWKKQTKFYLSLNFSDIWFIALLHIFVAWNGVQFILQPEHLFFFFDSIAFRQNYSLLQEIHPDFVYWFIFLSASFILLILCLKSAFEIELFEIVRKKLKIDNEQLILNRIYENGLIESHLTPPYEEEQLKKLSIKDKFNLYVNLIVPTIFHNIGIIIILGIIYLLFFLVYKLLIVTGLQIELNLVELLRYSIIYFMIGLIFFNSIIVDFILPKMAQGKNFSETLGKIYDYFAINKLNFILFYTFKLFLITMNVLILIYFMYYLFPEPIIIIPVNMSVQTCIVNIFTVFLGVILSMILNAVFVMFFNIYSICLKEVMFEF